jgi:uncharacterized protein
VKAGDVVSVRIKEVDAERKRIGLTMKSGPVAAASSTSDQKDRPAKDRPVLSSYSAAPPKSNSDNSPFAALRNLKLN